MSLIKMRDVIPGSTIDMIRARIEVNAKVAKVIKVQKAATKARVLAEHRRYQAKGKNLQAEVRAEHKARKKARIEGKKGNLGIAGMNVAEFEVHISRILGRMRGRDASEAAIEAADKRIRARREEVLSI